jgi:hypothetical protein
VTDLSSKLCTAFKGHRLWLSGRLAEVALAVKAAAEGSPDTIIVFDDATGRVVDLDLLGTEADIVERLSRSGSRLAGGTPPRPEEAAEPKGRGRPRLGVVAREVTLLPRQWEWLAAQPGGASAVLRRLVDEARRNGAAQRQRRAAQEAAYHFMLAVGGDLPGYEEGTRALFADDRSGLERCIAAWPEDIRAHALRLAFGPQGHPTSSRSR